MCYYVLDLRVWVSTYNRQIYDTHMPSIYLPSSVYKLP
jgi:hypothetical protein